MSLDRRNLLKLGGLSALGAAGLVVPLGAGARTKSISTLSKAQFPSRYRAAFIRPPVLVPTMIDGVAHYDITARKGTAEIVPGLITPVYGYNGAFPARSSRSTGHPVGAADAQPAARQSPRSGAGTTSPPTCTGRRRCRSTTATPATSPRSALQGLPVPELPGRPHAVVPRPRRALHRAERLLRPGRAVPPARRRERELLPQGEFDVPLTMSDAMFNADGSLVTTTGRTPGLWGDVILVNGRPWPVMKVKRRIYRFRILNADPRPVLPPAAEQRLPLHIVAHRRRPDAAGRRRCPPSGTAAPNATRCSSTSPQVPAGTADRAAQPQQRTTATTTTPDKIMAFDVVDDPVTPATRPGTRTTTGAAGDQRNDVR